MTIRKRLTLWYASLLTLIILALCLVIYGVMRVTMQADIDATLSETAMLIETNSRFVRLPLNRPEGQRYLFELALLDVFRASGVEVQVWLSEDGQFRLFDSSANLANYTAPLDGHGLGSTNAHYSYVQIPGEDGIGATWRVRTSPIWVNEQIAGSIQVAASMTPIQQTTRALVVVMGACCLVAVISSTLLSMWLAMRMTRPIEDITRAAQRVVETKDLSVRLPWHGPDDELGRLNEVFNRMLERLQHLFGVQQQFVHDISHELRTPLTGISGNLQLIQRYGLDTDSLDAMHADTERMSRLVNDLLLLARADYGGLHVDLAPVDLDGVVLEMFERGRVLAKDRAVSFRLGHIEPLRVNGNSDRLKQVMLNLLDNALKFTPDGGSILTDLYRDSQYAVIAVRDSGVGIKDEDLPHVFNRFYQSDRSRTHTGGGFGLGLSIVKWIVEAHGGVIRVESQVGGGTSFFVSLPLLDPAPLPEETHTEVTRPRLAAIRRGRPPGDAPSASR
jgi:signal transduction histidine kinase